MKTGDGEGKGVVRGRSLVVRSVALYPRCVPRYCKLLLLSVHYMGIYAHSVCIVSVYCNGTSTHLA